MSAEGGDGDPFELDPFGESEYDPSLAFAHVAAEQARQHFADATRFVEHELAAHPDRHNQIAVSARKSSGIQIADLATLAQEVDEARQRVDLYPSASVEFRMAVNDTVERFHKLKEVYDQLMHTAAQIAAQDPVLQSTTPTPIDPTTLLEPRPASLQLGTDLRAWYQQNKTQEGRLVVIKATPGVGKTYAMLQLAYQEHLNRQRVTVSVRTKQMIAGPGAEMPERVKKLAFGGRIHLAVIHGRDETNCQKPETVAAVMAHGYAPGPTVCVKCEYYPNNARVYGLGICGYYQERITADLMSKGARRGFHRQFPFVFTTHASRIAASLVQGGRYGGFMSEDVAFFDEDPTDAMEIDVLLSRRQCDFTSRSHETHAAGVAAHLFRETIELAKRDRAAVEATDFRAPGSRERNTHPIHSKYDSVYTGDDLIALLERALGGVRATTAVGSLSHTLHETATQEGFHAQAGALAEVTSVDDINTLDIPPKNLALVAEAIYQEMDHTLQIRQHVYQQIVGRPFQLAGGTQSIIEELEKHTEVQPMSYAVRLECLPADAAKKRRHDEWRFVVRDFRPFANTTATIIVGDAYAQKDHYEHLFERPADLIEVVSQLHPDARFLRILDSNCNISTMRDGGWQRVLALIGNQLSQDAKFGDRVLFYGHQELRPHVEKWAEGLAEQLQLGAWAYEHWWGGRGKDQYNGWEFVVCLSDPVLSLSGIKHVANARAFQASRRAKAIDEKLLHAQRCEVGSDKRGPVYALRASHPRVALEHDRMNVAEGTQAQHRGRPAHNPVRVITIGEMEQSPDLVAQTETVLGPDYRGLTSAVAAHGRTTSRTRQEVISIDRFVTVDEALAAMLAILDHYGVYSSWFAHSLCLVMRQDVSPAPAVAQNLSQAEPNGDIAISTVRHMAPDGFGKDPGDLLEAGTRDDPSFLREGFNRSWDHLAIYRFDERQAGGESVPDDSRHDARSERRDATEPAGLTGGATDPAGGPGGSQEPLGASGTSSASSGALRGSEGLLDARSVIERVWHPSPYWRSLIGVRQQPKAIEAAHALLLKRSRDPASYVRSVPVKELPRWGKGFFPGRKPTLFFHEGLLRVDAALREYYRIVENQYGLVTGGRLVRPNAEMQVPGSRSAVPF